MNKPTLVLVQALEPEPTPGGFWEDDIEKLNRERDRIYRVELDGVSRGHVRSRYFLTYGSRGTSVNVMWSADEDPYAWPDHVFETRESAVRYLLDR